MLTALVQLLPVFVSFGLGILLRSLGLAERTHGDFLLRFVFYVTLPLLILTAVPSLDFHAGKALLPVINILVNLACMSFAYAAIRLRNFNRKIAGTLVVNTGIVNNSFMFPFILAVYGQSGFADAILFDFGNAVMTATFVYALAFRFGGERSGGWTMVIRILKSPLVWALFVAVLLAISGRSIPPLMLSVIAPLANMTGPLILIALGIFVSLKLVNLPVALMTAGIRMGGGLLAGLFLATVLGLEGVTFTVVVLCCSAPIGFTALTYSALAELDTDLSASAVSISLVAGMIYIPVLILVLKT